MLPEELSRWCGTVSILTSHPPVEGSYGVASSHVLPSWHKAVDDYACLSCCLGKLAWHIAQASLFMPCLQRSPTNERNDGRRSKLLRLQGISCTRWTLTCHAWLPAPYRPGSCLTVRGWRPGRPVMMETIPGSSRRKRVPYKDVKVPHCRCSKRNTSS